MAATQPPSSAVIGRERVLEIFVSNGSVIVQPPSKSKSVVIVARLHHIALV